MDLWDIFLDFLSMLFEIFKPLLFYSTICLLIFAFILLAFLFYYTKIKKIKKIKPYYGVYHERNFFLKIFVDLPRQIVLDYLTRNPYDFNEYGIHMICGTQGAGKTITAVYLLQKWKKMYPDLKIYSNSALKFEDGELTHWKQLISNNNGKKGVANFIDEIHTWFSNAESKDLPPEVLGEISQQRKQRKAIVGTAQIFGKIAKPLREQTHYVYRPHTFFGCLTIVFMADAHSYDSEKDKFKKGKGVFFFVHNKELRDAYDTYKRISRYKNVKFAPSLIAGSLVTDVQETSKRGT